MYPVGIVGSEGLAAARDRLVDGLADHGTVATVDRTRNVEPAGASTGTAYRLGPEGGWAASGDGVGLGAALDRLAPAHEYTVVTGHPEADIPHVAVGDPTYDGGPLLRADAPGALDPDAVAESLAETTPHETLESLVAGVKESPQDDRAGAIATFTGRVRERDDPDDDPTEYLEFETYDGVARERMRDLESELERREGVFAVRMHHRTGVVEAGEDIVFVVVLAGHRGEAFETVSDGIDRLKAEVPIFKKEVTVDEEFWLHER
ncbi:MAG: molybdopterin synthase [Halobacteriales archaeon]